MARCTDHAAYGDERAFENWRAARNKALRELDLGFARAVWPEASGDEVRIMALHKARYECVDIEAELRHQSRAWLQERGHGRFKLLPWPDDGSLPG
jgi:hypothetical protein